MRLLVIDDEPAMRTALAKSLETEGYRVVTANDGEDGLEKACSQSFDLVLLDVMMPKLDGYAVCQELRRRGREFPVLMLTARAQVEDRVTGLDSGADDYLIKPFSLKELLARVRALLRRNQRDLSVPNSLWIGAAQIDFSSRTIQQNEVTYELNEKEVGILRLLIGHSGEAVSREHFLDVVWSYNAYPSTRTVDNFIKSLRDKLEPVPARPKYIVTVRGLGYRLEKG
mgnify:CR=1 FL=1